MRRAYAPDVDDASGALDARVEEGLWPLVEALLEPFGLAGVAVAVVRDGEVVLRGFGVRDLRTLEPVTTRTMFHLASVSKPFVATAVVSLDLDLDAPATHWIPELVLADGRQDELTLRRLLSHTSGLGDVSEFGWVDPQLGDDALLEFARSLADWRLQREPGAAFAYSNTGYELLGLVVARATGTTFEAAMRRVLLDPMGMRVSTFLRAEVAPQRGASPHVGRPLTVPDDAYPYTRRHAPSSTLHSDADEMSRWMLANLERDPSAGPLLDPDLRELVRRPVAIVGEPPWEEEVGLGWFLGTCAGRRTVSHSGADPGFGCRLVLVPEHRTGVVVLANSNTVPTSAIATAAVDLALADVPLDPARPFAIGDGVAALRALVPPPVDLDDEGLGNAVWGAIELHRTDLVWSVLRTWCKTSPESSAAWTMSGWAHQVDGRHGLARSQLRRALELDADNADARLILGGVPSA